MILSIPTPCRNSLSFMKKEDWQAPVFIMGLTMGTLSTLLIKLTYDLGAFDPITGDKVPYEKPIFLTFIMFLGMAFSLPLYLFLTWHAKNTKNSLRVGNENGSKAEKSPLMATNAELDRYSPSDPFGDKSRSPKELNPNPEDDDEEEFNVFSLKLMMFLMIPSLFDMLGTILSTIGLLYVNVSLYQLSRCSVIIVTALFKRLLLKHQLSKNMYAGVIINTIAMVIVGVAAIYLDLAPQEGGELSQGSTMEGTIGGSRTATGLIFIIASCVVQGAQYVYEEKVMSFDNVPPLVLIGFEGVNGIILSVLFAFPFAMLMPGNDNGYYEDIFAAFTLPFTSTPLLITLIAFFLVIMLYNVFCIYITFLLSAIYHCFMDSLRPFCLWIVSLVFLGQKWNTLCWFELLSMALIFYGTAVYGGHVKLPFLPPPKLGDESALDEMMDVVPIRDTPVFSARMSNQIHPGDSVNATAILTQSPAFRAQSPSHQSHNHSHGNNSSTHSHSHQSSRAQQAAQYGSML